MPQNWKIYKFSELYDTASGLSKSRDQFGFGYPFLTFKDVFYNYFLPESLGDLANTNDKERFRGSVKIGDIFLTRTSETLHELGMSSVSLKNYPNATFNGFCKRLRVKEDIKVEIDPLFIGYYLRSSFFRNEVSAHATMTTRASLNNSSIASLTVTLPKIEEQKSIGKILKALDDKIELNLQQNKTLEEMAMALYKHWFVDFGPFQDGEFIESELGMIPEGWEVETIGQITQVVSKGTTPRKKDVDGLSVSIPFLKVKDISNDGLINQSRLELIPKNVHEKQLKRSILKENDILFSIAGTIGRVSIVPSSLDNSNCNQALAFIRLNGRYNNLTQVYFYFKSEEVQSKINSSIVQGVQANVSLTVLKELKIIIPISNLSEKFNLEINPLFNLLQANRIENQTLTKLRDTILPKLISGEVRVKDVEKTLSEML